MDDVVDVVVEAGGGVAGVGVVEVDVALAPPELDTHVSDDIATTITAINTR